jgi:hypothetical protein
MMMRQVFLFLYSWSFFVSIIAWSSTKPFSLFTISKPAVHNMKRLSMQYSQQFNINKSVMKSILSFGISAGIVFNIPQLSILTRNTLIRQGIGVFSY